MGGECALYVMAGEAKTPKKQGLSGPPVRPANLDASLICPYTSAVPGG